MILAIDTGGTKTLLGLFNEEGTLAESNKFETPKDYPEYLEKLKHSILEYTSKHPISACAMAMPGRIDHQSQQVIAFGNLPWENISIVQDLRSILPNMPMILENDSKVAGLSEALLVPEYKRVLYVTIGTGIGTAFIVNGEIEHNLSDSEAGQGEIEFNGSLQQWEHIASGKAIVAAYGKRAADITDDTTWQEIAYKIMVGLLPHIAMLQPDVVIFGGGVGSHFAKFEHHIMSILKDHTSPLINVPVILQAKRAEEAVIYGGYALASRLNKTEQ